MAASAIPPFTYTIDNPQTAAFPNIRDIPTREFQTMLKTHPFLYRVHDNRSYVSYTQHGFIAREYVNKTEVEIRHNVLRNVLPLNFKDSTLRLSVKEHIRNFNRRKLPDKGSICPWISASPLWTWALGEAVERNRMDINDPDRAQIIRVSVIDLRKLLEYEKSLGGRVVFYGMELLHLTQQRYDEKAPRWTNTPQEIMVYGMIPRSAVVNTITFAEPFSTMTRLSPNGPNLPLPLPSWFYQNYAVSENMHHILWPRCRWDYWYCGDHRGDGMRTLLLNNFKSWSESRMHYHLHTGQRMATASKSTLDDIASASFRLAAFLILPEGTFDRALRNARTQVQAWTPLIGYEVALQVMSGEIFEILVPVCEMAEIIAMWGFDRVDDPTSRYLSDRIHQQASQDFLRQMCS
ncbi:hypothetical protein GYMLUDRAFT_910866 [Collybiopsis luxurians FD-317 M1]|nr:hypothetical protein GYMLUDRAFT_910866 [Collybiopsis luxurians FD-317 M1]